MNVSLKKADSFIVEEDPLPTDQSEKNVIIEEKPKEEEQ